MGTKGRIGWILVGCVAPFAARILLDAMLGRKQAPLVTAPTLPVARAAWPNGLRLGGWPDVAAEPSRN